MAIKPSIYIVVITFLLIKSLVSTSYAIDLGIPLRPHVPNQILVQFENNPDIFEFRSFGNKSVSIFNLPYGIKTENVYTRPPVGRGNTLANEQSLYLFSVKNKFELESLSKSLEKLPQVKWISPNFIYEMDFKETFEVTEEDLTRQRVLPHEIMDNFSAWEITKGSRDIVIAVTDDGVDINHSDLYRGIWYNDMEAAFNGIDDDGNGFIDDINGWDFTEGDPSVLPSDGNHGTFVTGIIVGNGNEDSSVLGIAPESRVMPIRFCSRQSRLTSASISKAYHYAVQNGASIINTSYNIDTMVDDPVYLDAVKFAYDKGLFLLNSAGNNRAFNPPRSKIHELLLVASTDTEKRYRDMRSYFSNYGPEIDISAPGQDIYSSEKMSERNINSGTSFSTPFVAGAISLVWSVFPELNREQIWSKVTATSDDIDRIHIDHYKGKMGAGRLNSFRALTEDVPPPTIRGIEKVPADGKVKGLDRIYLNLKNVFDSNTVNHPNAFSLINLDSGQIIPFTSKTIHKLGTNQIKMPLLEALPYGRYQFRANAKILADPFGQHLDGNGDGIAGDDFVLNFESSIMGTRITFYY